MYFTIKIFQILNTLKIAIQTIDSVIDLNTRTYFPSPMLKGILYKISSEIVELRKKEYEVLFQVGVELNKLIIYVISMSLQLYE